MKRIFSFILAIAMIFSMSAFTINAAPVETDYNDAASHLAALNILKGDGKGNMMLDQNVTRYQAALFFVQALTGKTEVEIWNADKNSTIFSDVTEYGTAIDYAYGVKLILGRGNGVYGPNDYITYQDMLVMAVRALGYETTDMSYPYGYILAAQKLGLTDDIDIVNYKTDLNRGATAQIMWNMLNTEVAVVDPLTDKILYPGETGLTDTIINGDKEESVSNRKTLLEDSGLAGGKVTGTIVSYNEAKDEDEVDTITVNIDDVDYVIAASDMKIDATTPKVAYMGLSADIYVSVNDFSQVAYDDGDAEVIFVSYPTYTSVSNFDGANIKYIDATKDYFTFDGVKFVAADTTFIVKTFVDGSWDVDTTIALDTIFAYDSKDGYTAYPYATIDYRVINDTTVEVLLTEYTFGRYNVHNIGGVNYTVIGTEDVETTNYAGEKSVFVEKLVGFDKVIKDTTKTVANKYESAASVKVIGETVTAGDFVYYSYNNTDNVLTIGMNCGNFKTGRLTSYSESKNTVKIDGVVYSIDNIEGFDYQTYINALEAGKDNAKFITVNGDITYITVCKEDSDTNAIFDFAIISQNDKVIKSLLDDEDDYKTVNGVFYDGDVKVAMMNLTTGKWELVSVTGFATGTYKDGEFDTIHNISEIAKYVSIFETDKHKAILADFAALNGVVAVVDTKDGYTIAAGDNEGDDKYFTTGTAADGLIFSNNNNKTNAITADDEIDAARVSIDNDTVIVVINSNGDIGSRVGVQDADNSINATGTFYAASSNLIVLVTDTDFDVVEWKDAEVSNSDENWYITTIDTECSIEAIGTQKDPLYVITITDVFDMKNMKIVDYITYESDKIVNTTVPAVGTVLHMNSTGAIETTTDYIADIATKIAKLDNKDFDKLSWGDVKKMNFINGDTIYIPNTDADGINAFDINIKVITINSTGLSPADYDFSKVVADKVWVEDMTDVSDITVKFADTEKVLCEYTLDLDLINVIDEPTEGVLNDYIINLAAEETIILVPEVNNDDYNDAKEIKVTMGGARLVEDGTVTLVIYKVLR